MLEKKVGCRFFSRPLNFYFLFVLLGKEQVSLRYLTNSKHSFRSCRQLYIFKHIAWLGNPFSIQNLYITFKLDFFSKRTYSLKFHYHIDVWSNILMSMQIFPLEDFPKPLGELEHLMEHWVHWIQLDTTLHFLLYPRNCIHHLVGIHS